MAKKTAKKPAKSKPATPKATPKPAKAAKKTAPKKPASPPITNDLIGVTAGDVWGVLHGKGWQTLTAVKKAVDRPTDVTLAAVGWLAREGKLDFAASGRSVKITLR